MATVKSISDGEFQEFLEKNEIVLADFYADWCGPCHMVSPLIEELAGEMEGVAFCKVDLDKNKDRARDFGIMSIPTLLIFRKGKLVDRITGAVPKDTIRERLEKAKK